MVREYRPLEYPTRFMELIPEADFVLSQGMIPYIYDIHIVQALSTGIQELKEQRVTDLNSNISGSYVKLDIISASTDDKSALSGDVRKVKVWGIDRYYNMRVEEIATSGTTVSSSTNYFRETNTIYGTLFGSSADDAKGNIDVGEAGQVTTEILRIPANARRAQTARIWLPKNWRAKIVELRGMGHDDGLGSISKMMIAPEYYDEVDSKEEDWSDDKIAFDITSPNAPKSAISRIYGNDTTISKLALHGQAVNATETWTVTARIMLWSHNQRSSSQNKYMVGDL